MQNKLLNTNWCLPQQWSIIMVCSNYTNGWSAKEGSTNECFIAHMSDAIAHRRLSIPQHHIPQHNIRKFAHSYPKKTGYQQQIVASEVEGPLFHDTARLARRVFQTTLYIGVHISLHNDKKTLLIFSISNLCSQLANTNSAKEIS